MEKIRPFWRIVIGLFFFSMVVYASNMMTMGQGNPLLFPFYCAALVTWIYVCIRVKYVDPARVLLEMELEKKAAADAEAAKRQAERDAEEARRKAEREEFERTHGRLKFRLAGVTFINDDGTSRQNLLREVLASGCQGETELEEYEYRGKPAVRLLYDGHILGNVPQSSVSDFLEIIDRINSVNLDIQTFTPKDVDDDWDDDDRPRRKSKEKIYFANVTVVYNKAPD